MGCCPIHEPLNKPIKFLKVTIHIVFKDGILSLKHIAVAVLITYYQTSALPKSKEYLMLLQSPSWHFPLTGKNTVTKKEIMRQPKDGEVRNKEASLTALRLHHQL